MLAVTITPPWPWAICYLGKPVENRGWAPWDLKPGDKLAIHCGKLPSAKSIREAFSAMVEMGAIPADEQTKLPTLEQLRTQEGAIVAVATYGGTVKDLDSPWFCGPIGWLLNNIVVLPAPVKCRGYQKLWHVPADVLEQMRAQVRRDPDPKVEAEAPPPAEPQAPGPLVLTARIGDVLTWDKSLCSVLLVHNENEQILRSNLGREVKVTIEGLK